MMKIQQTNFILVNSTYEFLSHESRRLFSSKRNVVCVVQIFFVTVSFFRLTIIYDQISVEDISNEHWLDAASRTAWRAQTVLACWNFVTVGFHDVPEFRDSPEFHDAVMCIPTNHAGFRLGTWARVHATARSIPHLVVSITCISISIHVMMVLVNQAAPKLTLTSSCHLNHFKS